MDMINTKEEIENFFSKTLYAKQYGDIAELKFKVFNVIRVLIDYDFVNEQDDYYTATRLGKRVSELYLNPDTANYIIENLEDFSKAFKKEYITKTDIYSLINFISNTIEMKPLFRINKAEEDLYIRKLEEVGDDLIFKYDPFEVDYSDYLQSLKTSDILQDWIEEKSEDFISEKYKVTPGELKYKIDTIDWLLYSTEQIAMLKKELFFKNQVTKLRARFKYGIKEELLSLISLEGIGRVRARKLFERDYKNILSIKKANIDILSQIVGTKTALKLKEQTTDEALEKETKPLVDTPKEIKHRKVEEPNEKEIDKLLENYQEAEIEKETIEEKKKYGFTLTDFM